ncbi:MAG: hypothetical protein JXJ20_09195 [Anaerolineae bacterium]|jgi:ElaB/YqjD/DUF883 family membrane-anchored ribosome-binding protein|nr:hypothetical protein [Anaerolineae bacterium]
MGYEHELEPTGSSGTDTARHRTTIRDARRTVMQHAYAAKETAADQLIAAAERVRAEAMHTGDQEMIQQAQTLSRSLERGAIYLHGHTFDQMTGDATQIVQSKPWQAVMIAFLVGAIFGRSFRRNR